MSGTVIVSEVVSTLVTEKEATTIVISETQGPPGPKGEKGDVGEVSNLDEATLVSDPLAYYILAKN